MTKEELQARMLSNISDEYDKTEGSFFSDAVSPVAIELENSYASQGDALTSAFVDTSTGDALTKKCAELGINRKAATKATGAVAIAGAVGAVVPLGSLVASETVSFATMQAVTVGAGGSVTVAVECTQTGVVGNVPVGAVKFFPITLSGLSSVTNAAEITGGYDTETDKSLRQRYFEKVNAPATSGNSAHYKAWAKSVAGVGDAKVLPIWNGAGTVKVVICDADKKVADSTLITNTSAYIETQRPIGATVTVVSATVKAINVTATIVLGNGRTLAQVTADFQTALAGHFSAITFVNSYVSFAKVGAILYDVFGVADYSNLLINGTAANAALAGDEVPVVGTVVFS